MGQIELWPRERKEARIEGVLRVCMSLGVVLNLFLILNVQSAGCFPF